MTQGVIAALTLASMWTIFVGHIAVRQDFEHRASAGSCWWATVLTLVVILMLLTGCKTRPSPVSNPRVSCEPLPVCSVPPASSSTQLDSALWACVLEYRALYSSCVHRQTPSKHP